MAKQKQAITKTLKMSVPFSLDAREMLQGLELVSFTMSQEGHLFMLAGKPPLSYREVAASGASFAKAHPEKSNDFVVFEFRQGEVFRTTELKEIAWNYHFVQPLPNEELLLVCSRIRGKGSANNAQVFDRQGNFKRDFTLGDGIEHIQTTTQGHIWVGYFDEGVYGDYPISHSGLNCFDAQGNLLFSFPYDADAVQDFGPIDDCYALNVVSDLETYCYYYSDFPLVYIANQKIKHVWACPVQGAKAFAVWKNFVLFFGSYDRRNEVQLFEIIPEQDMKFLAKLEFVQGEGEKLGPVEAVARGSKMVFVDEKLKCYEIELQDVVES